MKTNDRVPITISIPAKVLDMAEDFCKQNDISLSEYVSEAMIAYQMVKNTSKFEPLPRFFPDYTFDSDFH